MVPLHRGRAPPIFAGVGFGAWAGICKLKDGGATDDLFAFLKTEQNAEAAPIRSKAMPALLIEADYWETWLADEWSEAKTSSALCATDCSTCISQRSDSLVPDLSRTSPVFRGLR